MVSHSKNGRLLANEIKRMAGVIQIAVYIPRDHYKKLTPEQWNAYKDSVFTTQ
jgi:hypothetical protein